MIDFGVAKATDQRLTEQTMFTPFGNVVGTPEYMSPEQAELNALDVDTAQQYLLAGRAPCTSYWPGQLPLRRERLREAAYTEVLRMIREEEPSRTEHPPQRLRRRAWRRSPPSARPNRRSYAQLVHRRTGLDRDEVAG